MTLADVITATLEHILGAMVVVFFPQTTPNVMETKTMVGTFVL